MTEEFPFENLQIKQQESDICWPHCKTAYLVRSLFIAVCTNCPRNTFQEICKERCKCYSKFWRSFLSLKLASPHGFLLQLEFFLSTISISTFYSPYSTIANSYRDDFVSAEAYNRQLTAMSTQSDDVLGAIHRQAKLDFRMGKLKEVR